jgi:hypothetical protein
VKVVEDGSETRRAAGVICCLEDIWHIEEVDYSSIAVQDVFEGRVEGFTLFVDLVGGE